jgi:hypothetical protein
MAMTRYTCPVCEKPVLDTTYFDWNCVEILFAHLNEWHKDELNAKKEIPVN